MDQIYQKPLTIHWVSTTKSPEFTLLSWALTHSSLVALDAEWKPHCHSSHNNAQQTDPTFPTVSLLQLACRLTEFPPDSPEPTQSYPVDSDSLVFLVDLQIIPLGSIYGLLKEMFVSQNILKLGFRFKQDLVYLSSTFCSYGCEPGFDKVEPFIDISSIYILLQERQAGRRVSKNTKSLATICEELLGVSLSKELQCSDWSQRPLTEEQKAYAAIDAHCLLEIFYMFQLKFDKGGSLHEDEVLRFSNIGIESKEAFEKSANGKNRPSDAANIGNPTPTAAFGFSKSEPSTDVIVSDSLCCNTIFLDESLSKVIRKYGNKLLLKDSDRKPKASNKKGRKQPRLGQNPKPNCIEWVEDWQGPVPWELSNGGDGCPKFICDVMLS